MGASRKRFGAEQVVKLLRQIEVLQGTGKSLPEACKAVGIRDTNFVSCHNPLHSLHRIPRVAHRSLNSVEPDAIELVNEMIAVLETLFPEGEKVPRVASREQEAGTAPNSRGEKDSPPS